MMKKRLLAMIVIITLIFNIYPLSLYGSEIKEPVIEAKAAILMDAKTGRILWEKNAHEPLAMASTTKIMTCILALEKGKLTDEVVVSKKAASAPRVKMYLQAGEKQLLGDLLYALMLQSYNDAAVAIAEHISGSVEEFCEEMTKKARAIGAKNTVFKTPNGLDAQGHQSTAYDLALITKYAMQNPKFVEIINTKEYIIPQKGNYKSYHLRNANRFLNEFPGANGVKTGYTGKAGYCFVGAARQGEMQLISVVLASGWGPRGKEQKWIDTKRLMKYGFDYYKIETLLEKDKVLKTISVEKSKDEQVSLYTDRCIEYAISDEEKSKIRVELELPGMIEAPVEKGEKLGEARVYIGDEFCGSVNLLADRSIERHDFPNCLKKVLNNWLKIIH